MSVFGQIGQYNQFPTLTPMRPVDELPGILDNIATDLAAAYSLRKLKGDYTGPLIRLRRASDNAERNFYSQDNDIWIDQTAITNWAAGANLFVVLWYDQSGNEFHALQNVQNKQPRFYNNPTTPFWQGDGSNDILEIQADTRTQLTSNGREASIFLITQATNRSQFTFGAVQDSNRSNRWQAHINWSNNNLYFDPGDCCQSGRNFNNSGSSLTQDKLYTFIRRANSRIVNVNGVNRMNNAYSSSYAYTATTLFGIGGASGINFQYANNHFMEFIMYNSDVPTSTSNTLETDMMGYWGL
jgi:hypothetical protein